MLIKAVFECQTLKHPNIHSHFHLVADQIKISVIFSAVVPLFNSMI